ncbi:MAG: hypothetical protein AB7P03_20680 [Kofleriaceae bacterium]
MARLSTALLAAVAAAVVVSGCQLYFDSDDGWGGGGDDDCRYGECGYDDPPPPPPPFDGGGYYCTTDFDCAGGCYCSSDGYCEEAGFCSRDYECQTGYHCDEDRASCVPDDRDSGSCAGIIYCAAQPPACPAGTVPEIENGCYTLECIAIASCDVPPACESLTYEADCVDRAGSCTAVYTGVNCTNPDGTACQGGADCDCETFTFDRCVTGDGTTPPTMLIIPPGATELGISTAQANAGVTAR